MKIIHYIMAGFIMEIQTSIAKPAATHMCRSPEFYTGGNISMCAVMDPYNVFQMYGFRDISIPKDLLAFNPPIFHEGAVLYEVDKDKKFRKVGNGSYANIYLAQFRPNHQPVVVKSFKSRLLSESVEMEFRIHKYLENIGYVPTIFGLVPTGSKVHKLGLVIEYLPNTATLEDILNANEEKQITKCSWIYLCLEVAKIIRSLHEKFVIYNDLHMNNILVQWRESDIKVYLIDFGDASFRGGNHLGHLDVKEFPNLAPEMQYEVSTPAVDVYSLGFILKKMKPHVHSRIYSLLVNQCLQKDPLLRPKIYDVISRLQTIGSDCASSPFLPRIFPPKTDIEYETFKNLTTVLIPKHIIKDLHEPEKWKFSLYNNILVTEIIPSNEQVVLKYGMESTFAIVRKEAMFHEYLRDNNSLLEVKGITILDPITNDVGILFKFSGQWTTLSDILNSRRSLTLSFCTAIALELTNAIRSIHKKHVIISSLDTDSIILNITDGNPKIKLFDLAKASFRGIQITEVNTFYSPEVAEGEPTSFESDIYRLGVVLSHIFGRSKVMPKEMKSIIRKCKAEDPGSRPTALQVLDSVKKVISGLKI